MFIIYIIKGDGREGNCFQAQTINKKKTSIPSNKFVMKKFSFYEKIYIFYETK